MFKKTTIWRVCACIWVACCVSFSSWAQLASAPDKAPAASFFQERTFSSAQLSPNGKKVAFKLRVKDSPAKLVVMDLATQAPTVVATFERESVGNFAWINNERLVFNLASWLKPAGQKDINPGLFAVDANGERYKQLAETIGSFVKSHVSTELLPQWTEFLRSSAEQNSDDIWVTVTEAYDNKVGADYRRVRKINTVTGRKFLGGFIGSVDDVADWFEQKVEQWVKSVIKISNAACTNPHTTYTAFTKSLQCE